MKFIAFDEENQHRPFLRIWDCEKGHKPGYANRLFEAGRLPQYKLQRWHMCLMLQMDVWSRWLSRVGTH